MYVYLPTFESGAAYFPSVFAWVNASIFLYQITLIGVLSLKLGAIQGPLVVPLPFLTLFFYYYCTSNFGRRSADIPLFESRRLLANDHIATGAYIQPELSSSALTLAEAIKEQEDPSALVLSDDRAELVSGVVAPVI